RSENRATSAGSVPAAAATVPWCRAPVCDRHDGGPGDAPRHKDAAASCGSRAGLRGQAGCEAAIAEASAYSGQLAQPSADRSIVRPPAPVANRTAIDADRAARPPLAHREDLRKV